VDVFHVDGASLNIVAPEKNSITALVMPPLSFSALAS
jgi:hypothetical protein